MNAAESHSVSLVFGDVKVRHTWACLTADCAEVEHPWTATVGHTGTIAEQHARATGHDTIVITEARTVHTMRVER